MNEFLKKYEMPIDGPAIQEIITPACVYLIGHFFIAGVSKKLLTQLENDEITLIDALKETRPILSLANLFFPAETRHNVRDLIIISWGDFSKEKELRVSTSEDVKLANWKAFEHIVRYYDLNFLFEAEDIAKYAKVRYRRLRHKYVTPL